MVPLNLSNLVIENLNEIFAKYYAVFSWTNNSLLHHLSAVLRIAFQTGRLPFVTIYAKFQDSVTYF